MAKARRPKAPADIFDAARAADVAAVEAFLAAGAKVNAENRAGFTALECAAMGADEMPIEQNLAILRLLIEAGSPLEHRGEGGRTALYLAAEFSPDLQAVQLLLDAGAEADICDEHGNHIAQNAMMLEVAELLSAITGYQIVEDDDEPEPRKMTAAQWRAACEKIDAAFQILERAGVITLHDAGYTQDDGFSDASDLFRQRGGSEAGLIGMCFYTRQDLDRAKRSSDLDLAFWGGPQGEADAMKRVGQRIVEAFDGIGLAVRWPGSELRRPIVDLRSIA